MEFAPMLLEAPLDDHQLGDARGHRRLVTIEQQPDL